MKSDILIQGCLIAFLDLFLFDNESITFYIHLPFWTSVAAWVVQLVFPQDKWLKIEGQENYLRAKVHRNIFSTLCLTWYENLKHIMYRGLGKEQWNKLSLSISSLSHATVNLILPLTEIMDFEASLLRITEKLFSLHV